MSAIQDLVDLFGVKPNGETVLIDRVPMPPSMKAKEIIRELIGMGDFDDDGSDHAMWLYAMQQYGTYLVKYEAQKG